VSRAVCCVAVVELGLRVGLVVDDGESGGGAYTGYGYCIAWHGMAWHGAGAFGGSPDYCIDTEEGRRHHRSFCTYIQ